MVFRDGIQVARGLLWPSASNRVGGPRLESAEAKREASRDGAPPIDLIDGERLCELLKEHRLGVRVTERLVEDVEVAPELVADL